LVELLPEFAELSDSVRVISLACAASGYILRVLMNAELEEAIGFLALPQKRTEK
jgi:hypothetical protein